MPVNDYENLDQAYKSLTDIELLDDENDYPVATIRVSGIGKIKITMLSEWDYYKHFLPMQTSFLNYYANMLAKGENVTETQLEKIKNKVNLFVNDLSVSDKMEDIVKKAKDLTFLLDDEKIRSFFFNKLKKFKVIPWWISFKRYQKRVRPIDTLTIFCFLWAFNVDGVKKNAKFLIQKISAVMNTGSPTVSKYLNNFDSYKKLYQAARSRLNSKNSSTSDVTSNSKEKVS